MPHRAVSAKQREREEELARQARLAYVGTLAGGLAHEIRSPLQAIELNMGLLSELEPYLDESLREKFQCRIGRVQREIDWLKELVSEFLSFARPPKLSKLPTDLNLLFQEIIDTLENEYRTYDIQIETEFDEELFPVLIDPNQFSHGVIMNLLTNAREAIGNHGTITVKVHGDSSWVYVEIVDNGPGIPEENRARIFDVFFSTKEHGTGLGLGIAARVCHELGCILRLKDTGPHGTTFEIRLPKARILTYEDGSSELETIEPAGIDGEINTLKESDNPHAEIDARIDCG